MQKIIVIGAGCSGLATAALLAKQGHQVHCIEQLDQAGGRVGLLERQGWRFDTGPSWLLMPEVFEHFFQLLGTDFATEVPQAHLDPAYALFHLQRRTMQQPTTARMRDITSIETLHIPHNWKETAQLFEKREPGAGAALEEYLNYAEVAYNLAKRYFLYTTFADFRPWITPEILRHGRWLTELLGTSLQRYVNKRFQDPILRQVLQYPAVFLASRPQNTPALYHILSHTDLRLGPTYPHGGFQSLIQAMERQAQAHGVQFHYGESVEEILRTADNKVQGVRTNLQTYSAQVVVSTADRHHTETVLLEATKKIQRQWAKRNAGISAVVVCLGIQGKLPQLSHHNLLLSADWEEDFAEVWEARGEQASASIYVCMPSYTDPTVAPPDCENIFILIPTASNPALGHGSAFGKGQESHAIKDLAQAAIDQLSAVVGEDLHPRIRVRETIGPADFAERYHSWQGSALGLAHTLRQSAWMRGTQRTAVAGLYVAGATTTPGVGLPMCLISAENILKLLADDTSTTPLQEL